MARVEAEYEPWYFCWYLEMFPFDDTLYDACDVTDELHGYKVVSPKFSSRLLFTLDPALME